MRYPWLVSVLAGEGRLGKIEGFASRGFHPQARLLSFPACALVNLCFNKAYRRCQKVSTTWPAESTVRVTTKTPSVAGRPSEGGRRHTYKLRPVDPRKCSCGGPNFVSTASISSPCKESMNSEIRRLSRRSRHCRIRSESSSHRKNPPTKNRKTEPSTKNMT